MSGGREHILNPARQTLSASVSPPLHLGIHKKSEFNYLFFGGPSLDPRVYPTECTLEFQIEQTVGKKFTHSGKLYR